MKVQTFALVASVAICVSSARSAMAQATSTSGQGAAGGTQSTEETQEPSPGARLPWASLKFHLIVLGDYTWFTQDAPSTTQVGGQDNQFEFRADRISLTGSLFNNQPRPWGYVVAFEYHGLDGDPDNNWSFYDYALRIPVGILGNLWLGKMKEPFSYEMVGDSASLPQSERILSPFFVSRSVGARLNKTFPGDRATVAVGAFNDWFEKDIAYKDSRWDVVARATGLPIWARDGKRFLHLGAAWRYQGADEGVLRFKGQPESHVADNFVDTGQFPAKHANEFGAEMLWNEGPVSVLAEYVHARVDSPEMNSPSFGGWYATVSWVVTGETRPYDRSVGYARKVTPSRRWGAIELDARYSAVDTTSQSIDGGDMTKWLAAASYYATKRTRFTISTGQSTLDRMGLRGKTFITLARAQWIF